MSSFSLNKLEPFVFYALLVLFLIPVWSVDFFVTGDGPCHLYNSKILLDWWQGVHRSFYEPFYYVSTNFDPNWLFNLITAFLLVTAGPDWTEKIFFSLYILGFGFGFRFLISQINPKAKFISSLGMLFCYHKLIVIGYLNNALSFAIWFWVAGWWWRQRNEFGAGLMIINACLILLLYSAHPTGLIFCMMMIGSMMLGLLYDERNTIGWKKSLDLFYRRFKSLLLSAMPAFVLFVEFIFRNDLTPDQNNHSIKGALENFVRLSSLVTLDSVEITSAVLTAIVCFLVTIFAVVLRLKARHLLPSDGLLLFIGLVLFMVLIPPQSISGGLDIPSRLAMIPFIAMLCWAATANFPLWSQLATLGSALVLGLSFLALRLPILQKASDYASEIYTCHPFIQDTSTLLVLNYDWKGQKPVGHLIADRIWLFTHVDCYLGIDKSIVISDNYEAHFNYFPVRAHWQTDMYGQTDKDQINFDHRPPRADILNYKRRTSQDLDYVLMIGYREVFIYHPYTQEIFSQLEQGYDQVFSSEHRRAILYERKDFNVE